MRPHSLHVAIIVIFAAAALAGCSGTAPDEAPPVLAATPPASSAGSEAVASSVPVPTEATVFAPGATADRAFKIGRPYRINGIWYHPAVDWDYVEEGVASWYGAEFHGRDTANGERFDMHDLSAAHRTLPLPSMVIVTNLENGRSLKLRVNDRGPFARDRIIDVSKSAAKALGFYHQGTARVRVELVVDESMRFAGLVPAPTPTRAAAPTMATVAATRTGGGNGVSGARAFIQAGAFADGGNASRAGLQLARLAPVVITYGALDAPELYRVRLGPLGSADEADRMLAEVIRAGFPTPRVIVE